MKTTFDIEAYVQQRGGRPVKKREWALTCPVCGKEDKLVVNVDKGVWHCWVCEEYRSDWSGKKVPVKGAGGLIALVRLLDNCSKERATAIIASGSTTSYDVDLSELNGDWGATEASVELTEITPPPGWQPIMGNLPYCEKRGITADDVRYFGLVYCDTGRYRNRLVFPVWENNKLMYYQARAMWDAQPGEQYVKSLNPPKIPGAAGPSDVLMNLESAKHYPRVAITEGPIDCIHAGVDAVCTFGKKISDTQIKKLVYAGVKAVDLMWDGPSPSEPKGAWPEMLQAATRLSGIFDLRLVFLPQGDPGDYSRHDLQQFRLAARPAATVSRLAML